MVKVVITSHGARKPPDFGSGVDVLATQEISFTDNAGRGFKSPLFSLALREHEERLIREAVHIEWEEIKRKRGG